MIIGINYLVKNLDPLCLDFRTISTVLEASFYKDLLPVLCASNYEYYYYVGIKPTKYFYTLELIGEVDGTETQFINWSKLSIYFAWLKMYSG